MVTNGHQIYLRRGDRQRLRERFSVSDVTLSEALNFRKHSKTCREIRQYAVNVCRGILI